MTTTIITIFILASLCAGVLLYVLAPTLKRNKYMILHAIGVAICAFALFLWATESTIIYLPFGD